MVVLVQAMKIMCRKVNQKEKYFSSLQQSNSQKKKATAINYRATPVTENLSFENKENFVIKNSWLNVLLEFKKAY